MAGEGVDSQQALDIISNLTAKGDGGVNVNDIAAYTPQGFNPQQQQDFNAQYQPIHDALPVNEYYPGINHNINVGNYSGNEIGSTTLFAPDAGLVPIGMMDARDAAVKRAAMRKAKDIEDFNLKNQPPTTKHVAVQKNLTDKYYSGLQQWQQNALKKAGGNQAMANQMLKQDPSFNQWNKSMQDTAKFHDAIVEHSAVLHADEKDPNFVISPELRQQQAKLMNGLAYLDKDPFSKEGQRIGADFIGTKALYDLDKSVNTAIDKAIPNIEQLDPTFKTRGKNETATYLEKEYFTPESRKEIAENIWNEKYNGTGITLDQVQKNVDAKLGEKIKRKTDTYDKWFKPEPQGDKEDYNAAQPATSTAINVKGPKSIGEVHMDNFYKTTATDEQKKISVSLSKHIVDTQGKGLNLKAGQVEGTVSGVGNGYYDKIQKRFLQPKEVEELKAGKKNVSHDIEMRPAVVFTPEKEKGEKGQGNGLIIDASEIKGKFPNKGNRKGFDHLIEKTEADATAENAKRKGTGWPVAGAGKGNKKSDPLGIL